MKHLLILIIAACLAACYGKEPDHAKPAGTPLPTFSILMADSSTYLNTQNIPTGKPFILFFFGPHCPYSKTQMKEITEHINEFKNISIYAITSYPFRDMKQFCNTYHLGQYPGIHTGFDYKNFFAPYFEVTGVPYLLIYDSNKKLKKTISGKTSSDQLIAAIVN
jgi:thiol-disulfide isomerase/thioredoxin